MKKHFLYLCFIALLVFAYTSKSANTFQEISKSVGIDHLSVDPLVFAAGVAVFDYNGDGWDDIYLTGGEQKDKLYKNNGNGTFTDVTIQANITRDNNLMTSGVAAGDYDNDGDKDIFVGTRTYTHCLLYRNNGNGTFTEVSNTAQILDPVYSSSISLGDLNLDGYLDFYVSNYASNINIDCYPDKVYINRGDGTFGEYSTQMGLDDSGCGLANVMVDFDNDGDLDIGLANDFGEANGRHSKLFKNEYPALQFRNVSKEMGVDFGMYGMCYVPYDFDENGFVDFYLTNWGNKKFMVYDTTELKYVNQAVSRNLEHIWPQRDGPETVANTYPSASWGCAWLDFNNDLSIDLFLVNGSLDQTSLIVGDPLALYKNNGSGNFTNVANNEGIFDSTRSRGAALFDMDNDGDYDIVVSNVKVDNSPIASTHAFLYKNTHTDNNNYLKVKVKGNGPRNHPDAYGARVFVYMGKRMLSRDVDGGGGAFQAQSSSTLLFSLSPTGIPDSVVVRFPGGDKKTIVSPGVNKTISIIQDIKQYVAGQVCPGSLYKNVKINKDTLLIEKFAKTGYDSIIYHNVKVNSSPTITQNIKLCAGEKYQNKVYTNDTTITQVLKTSNNCDSTIKYVIKVNPKSNVTIDTSICYAGFYKGQAYFKDQTVIDKYVNQYGCDSLVTSHIKILPSPKSSGDTTVCYGGLYKGTNYFKTEVLTQKFQSTQGCDSVYTFTINVIPEKITQLFDTIDYGGTYNGKVYYKSVVLPNMKTSYQGCDSLVYMNLFVKDSIVNSIDLQNHDFKLTLNPNPYTENTTISFYLNELTNISIDLYDNQGKLLGNIINQKLDEGLHSIPFNLKNVNGSSLSNGTYLVILRSNNLYQSVKLIVKE